MGYIIRKGYVRRAYRRKSYTRSDGTRVKASVVKRTHVKRHRVPDKGMPGKTPARKRVLPKLKKGELERYKYHVKDAKEQRERSIRKMIEKARRDKALKNLRHLVVLRSYNKRSPYYKKLNSDVKYAQQLYHKRIGK